MNDTPRTDEVAWPETGLVEGDFARQLERELAAVTEQRDVASQCYKWCYEDRKRIIEELAAAREEIERLDTVGIHSCHNDCQRPNCVLRRELKAVTEQRDEEREIYGKSYSAELARSNHYKQQRDRLAEAIRKHKETLPFAPDFCDEKLYEALAGRSRNIEHELTCEPIGRDGLGDSLLREK
jgi:hypothetical protein